MKNSRRLTILDTTLRDGAQSPGFAFSSKGKIRLVSYLERLGVDVIEAGFPAASQSQFRDIQAIAERIKLPTLAVLARSLPEDIVTAAQAIKAAPKSMIHLSIATSPIHRDHKLRITQSQVIETAVEAVKFAKGHCPKVEMGAEDATRTEPEFLLDFCSAVSQAGADIINIADTVGYANPEDFSLLIRFLHDFVPDLKSGKTALSVHCHNDLGLATANTLAGIRAGASQAETTFAGIGERAGNAPLEELIMALNVRKDLYGDIATKIRSSALTEGRILIQTLTGMEISPLKPVIGRNVFVHSSGIHQNGIVADPSTYELFSPGDIGERQNRFILTAHSGSSGVQRVIRDLCNIDITDEQIADILDEIKSKPGPFSLTDIIALLNKKHIIASEIWTVSMKKVIRIDNRLKSVSFALESSHGRYISVSAEGESPFESFIKQINSIFTADISIKEISFGYAGVPKECKGHFFMKAICRDTLYFCERYGTDDLHLFAEAVFDIINELQIPKEGKLDDR
jgi:2-isopropylmalate synthase